MLNLIQFIFFIIWLVDVLNISYIVEGVDIAVWLDHTVPLNTWFWILFWLLMPSSNTIVKVKGD